MKRRDFIAKVGAVGAAATFPRVALAQAKVPRIVVLSNGITEAQRQAMLQGLQDFGLMDGRDVLVEFLTAPTVPDVPAYAAMAVAKRPDLIWTLQSASPLALKTLTSTIPVVFGAPFDPVAIGIVPSYAHPGGNMTGNMQAGLDISAKQISLVRETLPSAKRLVFVALPTDPNYPIFRVQMTDAATTLGFSTSVSETNEGDDLAGLFDRVKSAGAEAVYVIPSNYLSTINADLIARLSIERRLPTFGGGTAARSGFLLGYGVILNDVIRRSASYVSAILKGAKPGDLPVEGPTVRELVVNQKTAKALGITIPQSVLFQATEVIQ